MEAATGDDDLATPSPSAISIPNKSLVLLAGPSGSGKSTWAAQQFRPDQVVSSDALRALVGVGEHDQRAGTDAFAVLDDVLERRLKRGLFTVVDSLGLDVKRRAKWIGMARKHDRPVHAIAFDTPANECRARNKARDYSVPAKVISDQIKRWPEQRALLAGEVDAFHPAARVRVVPAALALHLHLIDSQKENPMSLRFGLCVSRFDWPGATEAIAPTLGAIAHDAERVGFDSLWVMDHFMQIPQAGREWDPMMESTSTLGFLAASTETIRLGTLVTGITYRNVAHVGKIAATLDVLSGGRAMCGLGAGWFGREHHAYGWNMPPLAERYELLEDALELFPLLWGPGTPSFEGRQISVAEASCYPRPIQERIPILVGGSGEKKTLRLVARHADACNLFGEPDVVQRKVEILHEHCAAEGRNPADISVTQLSSVLCRPEAVGEGAADLELNDRLMRGTAQDHIGRFRALAEAGVDEVIVSLADIGTPDAIENFAPVIDALR